jgi:hypothetical protein
MSLLETDQLSAYFFIRTPLVDLYQVRNGGADGGVTRCFLSERSSNRCCFVLGGTILGAHVAFEFISTAWRSPNNQASNAVAIAAGRSANTAKAQLQAAMLEENSAEQEDGGVIDNLLDQFAHESRHGMRFIIDHHTGDKR